mmetsp:Transcript_18004/g.31909  ORF Transcript_18004/g.31909 Transcript_18004/m.31909 type:complete len:213 (-) Transcript_18004:1809-2447(-)
MVVLMREVDELRRHVFWGPEECVGPVENKASKAEVAQLCVTSLIEQNIARLQVSVRNFPVVQVAQPFSDASDVEHRRRRPLLHGHRLWMRLASLQDILETPTLRGFYQHVDEELIPIRSIKTNDEGTVHHGMQVSLHTDAALHFSLADASFGDLLQGIMGLCGRFLLEDDFPKSTTTKLSNVPQAKGIDAVLLLPAAGLGRTHVLELAARRT